MDSRTGTLVYRDISRQRRSPSTHRSRNAILECFRFVDRPASLVPGFFNIFRSSFCKRFTQTLDGVGIVNCLRAQPIRSTTAAASRGGVPFARVTRCGRTSEIGLIYYHIIY